MLGTALCAVLDEFSEKLQRAFDASYRKGSTFEIHTPSI